MKLKAVGQHIIVKPIEKEKITGSGIIIPDSATNKPCKGTVVSAGNGDSHNPVEVKPGDTVHFSEHAGTPVEIDGEKLKVLKMRDVYAHE